MTRQETHIIKGIALLLMLWLHLFSNVEQTLACENYIFIGGASLANLITRACPPVGFFVFCGGYGLYYSYRKGQDKHYVTRIAKLFITYWLILLIFIPLCVYLVGVKFQVDARTTIYNLLGLQCSWDSPCWFLLPYALLSLSYPFLFPLYDKMRTRYILTMAFFLSMAMMSLLHFYGASYINERPYLWVPVCYLEFLFLFFCGATTLRCDILSRIRKQIDYIEKWKIQVFRVVGIILLVCLMVFINSAAVDGIYTLGVVFWVLMLPPEPNSYAVKLMESIRKHSMNMWMIHFILYAYLLHEFLFYLRYPLLIFVVLLGVSYICSIILNSVQKPFYRLLQLS